MRVLVRIILQFAIVLAGLAAVVAWSGNPEMWLLLYYLLAILVPGALVSALLLAPLERGLDRRGRGALIYAAGPGATAVLALPFMQLSDKSWGEIVALVPGALIVGAAWGLLWALTRPVARLLFGPETG
ncbi:MAG TPA: hypothetical protein VEC11_10130 [Allosphingosinicella sp.]|nr:hypothetical protein [Allosphingosinicella sp.]